MIVTYLSIHFVNGLIGLPNDLPVVLLEPPARKVRALLTMSREPHFLHLRRCAAYGTMIGRLLKTGGGAPEWPELFKAALSATVIQESSNWDKPLLVIEATGTIATLSLDRINDVGDCGIGLNLFDQTEIAAAAKTTLEAAVTAISLVLPPGITPTVKEVGTVAYAVENNSGRVLYSLGISASGSMTSASTIGTEILSEATRMAQRLSAHTTVQPVVHLLARSLQTADSLQAFLTAWRGLRSFSAEHSNLPTSR